MSGFTGSVVAAIQHEYSFMDYLPLIPISFFYLLLHLYSFNLCNQIAGAEEDKINKPDRPIPSGMLTIQGAKYRWYFLTALYILAGVAIGNVWSSLLWIFFTTIYNYGGWDKHWFSKNCISMPIASASTGWAAWSLVSGDPWMTPNFALSVKVISLYTGITLNIQDLRDEEGDRILGRKTMPIQFGMTASKIVLAIIFFLVPVVSYIFLMLGPLTAVQVVYYLAGVLMHLYISLRLLLLDKTSSDLHHTYHFYSRMLPYIVLSAALFY